MLVATLTEWVQLVLISHTNTPYRPVTRDYGFRWQKLGTSFLWSTTIPSATTVAVNWLQTLTHNVVRSSHSQIHLLTLDHNKWQPWLDLHSHLIVEWSRSGCLYLNLFMYGIMALRKETRVHRSMPATFLSKTQYFVKINPKLSLQSSGMQCHVVKLMLTRRFRGAYCLHHQGNEWGIQIIECNVQ
jgi:hypothetical protein